MTVLKIGLSQLFVHCPSPWSSGQLVSDHLLTIPPTGTSVGPDQAQGIDGVTATVRGLLAEHQERKGEGQQRWRRHGMHEGSLQYLPLSLSSLIP